MKHRLVITLALIANSAFAVGPTIPPNPWEEDAPTLSLSEPCPDPPDGTCCASPCGKP